MYTLFVYTIWKHGEQLVTSYQELIKESNGFMIDTCYTLKSIFILTEFEK